MYRKLLTDAKAPVFLKVQVEERLPFPLPPSPSPLPRSIYWIHAEQSRCMVRSA